MCVVVCVSCLHVSDRSQQSSVSDEHAIPSKPETLFQHKAHKLRFVSSVEFRHSSGKWFHITQKSNITVLAMYLSLNALLSILFFKISRQKQQTSVK